MIKTTHYLTFLLKTFSGLILVFIYSCNYKTTDQEDINSTDTTENLLIEKEAYHSSGVKQSISTNATKNSYGSGKNNYDADITKYFDKTGNLIKSFNEKMDQMIIYNYKNDTLISKKIVRKDTNNNIQTLFIYENQLLKIERTIYPNKEIDDLIYTYNDYNLLIKLEHKTDITTYKYNEKKHLTEKIYTTLNDPDFVSTKRYEYNNRGWLIKTTESLNSDVFSKKLKTTKYFHYDHKGRLIKEKKEYNFNQESTDEFEYNNEDLVIKKTHFKSISMDSIVTNYHYTYW